MEQEVQGGKARRSCRHGGAGARRRAAVAGTRRRSWSSRRVRSEADGGTAEAHLWENVYVVGHRRAGGRAPRDVDQKGNWVLGPRRRLVVALWLWSVLVNSYDLHFFTIKKV